MIRGSRICLVAVLLIGATATPALAGQQTENGYKPGALGVSAILAADYRTAEAQLNRLDGVAANDPLRLINLGNVYAATGRFFDAQRAFSAVLNSPRIEVTTADGGVTTTYDVARTALRRLTMSAAAR